jgi:hypothetical protein
MVLIATVSALRDKSNNPEILIELSPVPVSLDTK